MNSRKVLSNKLQENRGDVKPVDSNRNPLSSNSPLQGQGSQPPPKTNEHEVIPTDDVNADLSVTLEMETENKSPAKNPQQLSPSELLSSPEEAKLPKLSEQFEEHQMNEHNYRSVNLPNPRPLNVQNQIQNQQSQKQRRRTQSYFPVRQVRN